MAQDAEKLQEKQQQRQSQLQTQVQQQDNVQALRQGDMPEVQEMDEQSLLNFNERIYRICAERYPLVERRFKQSEGKAKEEFKPKSKGSVGREQRKKDEKELSELRTRMGNAHIGLYGMRFMNRALEQFKTRDFYWKQLNSGGGINLEEEDKGLMYFLETEENAREENLAFLNDFASQDKERMRPHLQDMMAKILSEDLAWGMLNEHWMADHGDELFEKLERFRVFQDLYEKNDWFRDELPDDMKKLVRSRLGAANAFRDALSAGFERQGLDLDNLDIKRDFHYKGNKSLSSEDQIKERIKENKDKFELAQLGEKKFTMRLKKLNMEDREERQKEAERTDAPENEEYREAKKKLKAIPEDKKYEFKNALMDMAEDLGRSKFFKGRVFSVTSAEFKDAANNYAHILGRLEGRKGKEVSLEDQVNALLRLSSAARGYRYTHEGKQYTSIGKERRKREETILETVDKLMEDCLPEELKKNAVEPSEKRKIYSDNVNVEKEKVSKSEGQLKQLKSAWNDWKDVLSQNILDTPEERLLRYKKLFDTYREPLEVYASNKDLFKEYAGKKTIKFAEEALAEYTRVERELAFIRWSREKGDGEKIQKESVDETLDKELKEIDGIEETAPLDQKVDEGLKGAQTKAVLEVDQWVLRNIHNGGFKRIIGSLTDQSELATRLLQKTKRERLYIYYLIETRERVNPTHEGYVKSQDKYVPDVKKFKDQMIKTRFKLLSRSDGSYIYWDKLRQAMDICDGNRMSFKADYEPKEMKKDPKPEDAELALRKEKATAAQAALDVYKSLIEECGDDQAEQEKRKDEIEAAASNVEKTFRDMLENSIPAGAGGASLKRDAKDEGMEQLALALKSGKGLTSISFLGTGVSGVGIGMVGASTAVTMLTQIIGLWTESPHLSASQIAGKTTDIINSAGTMASGVMSGINGVFDTAGAAAQTVGFVSSGIGVVAGAVNIGVNVKRYSHVKSAKKLLEEKYKNGTADKDKREKKFDENMLELSKKLAKEKIKGSAVTFVGALIGLAGVLVPPAGMLLTVGSIGLVTGGGSLYDSGRETAMVSMFDKYFEVDRLRVSVMAKHLGWKKVENPETGKALYRDKNGAFHEESEIERSPQAEEIKKLVRNRIAKKYNHASYQGAATLIAGKYAKFIYDKLFPKPGEDGDYYKELLKAFGLSYKEPKGKQEGKPSLEQITRKIMGK